MSLVLLTSFVSLVSIGLSLHPNRHGRAAKHLSSSLSDAPFTDGEVETIRGYFEANINYAGASTGCVVASPDDTDPTYLYHWQRDAGISMNTLQYTAPNTTDFDERFQNYVTWVLRVQVADDPNGIDVLGEPKFNTDGSVYSGGWCRPQNDGPASRAIALTEYAMFLIQDNRTDYVKEYLYTPESSTSNKKIKKNKKHGNKKKGNNLGDCSSVGDAERVDCGFNGITQDGCENTNGCCWSPINDNPNNYPWCYYPNQTAPTTQPTTPSPTSIGTDAIKTDLNFVQQNWDQTSNNCDLWEEQTGPHWYTYMVQRHALIYGASLAAYFGDTDIAESWNSTAASMVSSIQSFDSNNFIDEGTRSLDCSIIVGTLYGGMDGLYGPTDTSVLNTMSQIQEYWATAYSINTQDDSNNIPGTLIGRYESDTYNGCNNNGGSQGHAWILCTNALGDVYYRNAQALMEEQDVDKILNGEKLRIYANIIKKSFPKASKDLIKVSKEWDNNKLSYQDKFEIKQNVAAYMTTTGDDQLTRIKYHISSCNFRMSEQICETNGQEIGAYDLTWAYGTFLSAWYYRGEAVAAGAFPAEREIYVDWDLINGRAWTVDDPICAGCSGQCDD